MTWQCLVEKSFSGRDNRDLHVLRSFSSFVVVSEGKVLDMTDPVLRFCPLASLFYRDMRHADNVSTDRLKKKIKKILEQKIERFGLFTARRDLLGNKISVPFGASEMMMFAMRNRCLDAVVMACDGVGSVLVDVPEVVQGIGARMPGLFYTSLIPEVRDRLMASGGAMAVFKDARIDQVRAVEHACRRGYKKIGVTVNAYQEDQSLSKIRRIERDHGVRVTILAVCATGISCERVRELKEQADLVWACASSEVRDIIGPAAIMQVSERIPVFVLTRRGLVLIASYCEPSSLISDLDVGKQYLLSGKGGGQKIVSGDRVSFLSQARLPVRSPQEPRTEGGKKDGAGWPTERFDRIPRVF